MPKPTNFSKAKVCQGCNALQVPRNELLPNLVQPPIFSGKPCLNLTLSQSFHPPSLEYEVASL